MKKSALNQPHAPVLFNLHLLLGVITSTVCLYVFLVLGKEVFETEIINLDTIIMHFFYGLRTPPLTSLMFGFTFLASTPFFLVTSSSILLFLISKQKRSEAILFSSLFYMGVILNLVLKELFNRPRPTLTPLIHEHFASFPSGHSMNSFIFYFSLVYLFYHFTKNKLLTSCFMILATFIVCAVGISRIYLGVHFPTDVLGGYIAGLCWISSLLLFEKLLPIIRKNP